MAKQFTIYDFVVADREMVASGASYAFRTYTDKLGVLTDNGAGAEVLYNDGTRDRQGRPIGKSFSIGQSHYKLQARDNQTDYDGIPLFKFFLYAPFCEGSPNGNYQYADGGEVDPNELRDRDENIKRIKSGEIKQLGVKIKLMEDALDAELALETGIKRAEAQLSVGQIDDATLSEIAALIGIFGKVDKTMRYKVYEFAGKRPIDYFKYLNSGDRGMRALLRKGVADGVLKQKGTIIYWEETILGQNEDAAVSTLISDKDIMTALQAKIDLKVEKKSASKKK